MLSILEPIEEGDDGDSMCGQERRQLWHVRHFVLSIQMSCDRCTGVSSLWKVNSSSAMYISQIIFSKSICFEQCASSQSHMNERSVDSGVMHRAAWWMVNVVGSERGWPPLVAIVATPLLPPGCNCCNCCNRGDSIVPHKLKLVNTWGIQLDNETKLIYICTSVASRGAIVSRTAISMNIEHWTFDQKESKRIATDAHCFPPCVDRIATCHRQELTNVYEWLYSK